MDHGDSNPRSTSAGGFKVVYSSSCPQKVVRSFENVSGWTFSSPQNQRCDWLMGGEQYLVLSHRCRGGCQPFFVSLGEAASGKALQIPRRDILFDAQSSKMARLRQWHLAAFPVLVLLHLYVAPYTKVEESFNMQATHDLLEFGVPMNNAYLKLKALFDHMTFAGSVPRTFIGSLIVSFVAQPFAWLIGLDGLQKQILVRAVLGMMNAEALSTYTRAVKKAYGDRTALWYIALQASQFHVFFYASRALPNMFAFCLSTFALAAALPNPTSSMGAVKKNRLSFYLLTLATVIFRSELALLMGSQALLLLVRSTSMANRITLLRTTILPATISAALVGIVLTVSFDTYMWQSKNYLWPEASAFLFNVFPTGDHSGASAWGTSPWYWYYTSAIPRLLLNPAILLLEYGIFHTTQRSAILDQLIPSLTYTVLYSFLPHKETRFLFPVVPQLTLSLALTVSYLSTRRHMFAKTLTTLVILSTTGVALLSHAVLLPLSGQSYPGGNALTQLHTVHSLSEVKHPAIWSGRPQVDVYLTNLALQTGVTRFLEQPPTIQTSFKNRVLNLFSLGSQASDQSASPTAMVMPGSPDGRHPALTLQLKPTGSPGDRQNSAKGFKGRSRRDNTIWKYDKSPHPPTSFSSSSTIQNSKLDMDVAINNTNSTIEAGDAPTSTSLSKSLEEEIGEEKEKEKSQTFWSQFTYVILEPNSPLSSDSIIQHNFEPLVHIYSLQQTSPKLLSYHSIKQTDADANASVEDRLAELLDNMYGANPLINTIYTTFRDFVVRSGLTRGKWISYGLECRLVVLQRKDTRA